MAKNIGEGDAERKTISSGHIPMEDSHGYQSNVVHLSPRYASLAVRCDPCCNVILSRSARQHPRLRLLRCRALLSVLVLMKLCQQGCLAFLDPKRFARSRPNKTRLSSENRSFLDDDSSIESSRLQRLLQVPSAWRNGNITSWDIVDSVRALRGGTKETTRAFVASLNVTAALPPHNALDRMVGKVVGLVGKVVLLQSAITMLTSNDHALFDELASRLLSDESSKAVKTVRKIIMQFGDHGVVDVFKQYPSKDVVLAVLALSRLQKAALYYAEEHHSLAKEVDDPELLENLAHYAKFAHAAYGWKMDLALRGKLHLGDYQAMLKQTGVREEDVVAAHWQSKTHRPAYFLVRDVKRRKLVLCIRGTWSARDLLTDLCCTGEDFETPSGTKHAHQGMLEGARGVASAIEEGVESELAANPDYSLVVVGHSLGGGVAAVLATLWEHKFPGIAVYAYGCPCVGPLYVEPTNHQSVVSVVGEGDPISRLSLGHIADLSSTIAHLCENESLRNEILIRSDGPVAEMDEVDRKWCFDTLEELREKTTGDKMYPPGRILYISRSNLNSASEHTIALREMPPSYFGTLRLHARMLDMSRHVPTLYESYLQRLWNETHGASTIDKLY